MPEYIFDEIKKHIKEILDKTSLSSVELNELLEEIIILANIKIVALINFKEYLPKAENISPDSGDIPYFALALKFNCAIWSNDKELKNQKEIKVYNSQDLFLMK